MRTGGTRAAALAIVIGGFLALVGAQPASAHAGLTGSDPADGSVVTEPLDRVALTFTEAPLAGLDAGLRIEVTGTDGTAASRGDVTVDGTTMSTAVDLENGAYTVLWRYLSPDGHPIDGSFGFEYRVPTAEATAEPTSPASTPTSASTSVPSASAVAVADGAPAATDGIAPGVWIALGAGVVLVLAALVVLVARRGRGAGPTAVE
ncbi:MULTISPECIES: copper resistance CopC family protein [unclassified Curtobacterium]|uniref:copper resistance CopC family protein n=1 Tax=unclassified Curtobacterium TaxID=257496 RepID=UPI0008DE29D0|nr:MULTISPECIES: copper resistance CopC family protein [unclassified Curtobacterium]OIH97441.1 hypothetical protein BIU92_15735 [Curtobacterium sp. MCBA15_003]OII29441.1 hypothetical protein BIU94_12100 [Curtobacterium sp. MMLR14_006]